MGKTEISPGWDRLAFLLLGAMVAAVLVTFRDYGLSWDEPVQNRYGKLALNYYLTFGADTSSFRYLNLHWYGALFDMLAAAAHKVSPFGEWDTRHLLNGLVGVVGLAGTWRLGRELGGSRAGLIAVLLLALTPVWYGHSFFNPKDIPFAAGMTWATAFLVAIARRAPDWRWRDFLGFGLGAGAALGTRIGGLIALAYLAATLSMFAGLALVDRRPFAAVLRHLVTLAVPAAAATVLALAVMYLAWPWAQSKPLDGPLEALRSFSRFPISLDYPFFGIVINSTEVPWYYVPAMMLVKLPELVVAGAIVAALIGWTGLIRHRVRHANALSFLPFLILALAILFPPVYAAAEGAVLFDGMRHFLFVVPPLCAAAALALDRIWRFGPAGAALAGALLLATAANQIVLLARSHPYEYVVFNSLAGGVAGADGKFELDYWGLSFREAVGGMAERLRAEGSAPPQGQPWRVTVCGPEQSAAMYFPPGYSLSARQDIAGADFHITNTRYQCPRGAYLLSAPELVSVRRFGTVLATVYDLRGHNRLPYQPNPQSP